MLYNILFGLSGVIVGLILGCFIFNRKNNKISDALKSFELKFEEYRKQNEQNAMEVKYAINETSKLTKVLTTNQNLKGRFGEDCLEMILKTCFPNENINYFKQINAVNDQDSEIRPDFVVNLPNDKSILIDCKLNLEKYIEYKENKDEFLINEKKNNFIKDLNNTINSLSNKKYETAIGFNQPDFILMYIPLDSVITTLYTDNDFIGVIKNATEKNIIIVGTSSILTTIRLTKLLWAQNKQEQNMENIISIAQEIYESIAQHSKNLFEIKNLLDESAKRFNFEYNRIANENKLFKNAQQLIEFGIQAKMKKVGKKLGENIIHSDFIN